MTKVADLVLDPVAQELVDTLTHTPAIAPCYQHAHNPQS